MGRTVTFFDENNPGGDGAVRGYPDSDAVICTDHGMRPVSAVQVGWKIKRDPDEPWLTVKNVVEE